MALVFAGPSFLWWSLHGTSLGGWTRSEPEERLRDDWLRTHALAAAEAREVARAVRRGEGFSDPRLRAAACDWAVVLLRPVPSVSRRARRIWFGVGAVGVLATGGLIAYRLIDGRPEDLTS